MCCGSFVAARFVHRSPGLELFGGWGGIICESSPPQELMRAAGLLDSGDRGAHGGEFELYKLLQFDVDNMVALLFLDNSLELVSRISRIFRGRFKHVFFGNDDPMCLTLTILQISG